MPAIFDHCTAKYVPLSPELIDLYGYDGPLINIPRNRSAQVTLEGCKALCGDRTDWYPWSKQASTLTTWIFPVIGIILQSPFMSNAFWPTVFALARWIGNPMASLSYILWNIKTAAKCALLVDMSVPLDTAAHVLTDRETDFSSVRDSLYLLNVMNQYTMRPHIRQKKEAEGLLRIVLFSKDLRLLREDADVKAAEPRMRDPSDHGGQPTTQSRGRDVREIRRMVLRDSGLRDAGPSLEPEGHLNELRQKLAEDIRAARRRGAVPVYLSLLWFLFSLAISIQAAFGLLGLNQEAHDLALGCLLSWLPVLILCSVVDRNPVNPGKIQKKLNRLVERVRTSLMHTQVQDMYLSTIRDPSQQNSMSRWVRAVAQECNTFAGFFVEFAGQGRARWHYGCAHPILKDIERAYVAGKGRDWLHFEQEARTRLVLGDVDGGLDWLDYRELWQVFAAIVVVGGTIFGAFCLSFFTPTVGLGCRSGGYLIFAIVSIALLLAEMAAWWIMDARKDKLTRWMDRWRPHRRNATTSRRDAVRAERRQAWIKRGLDFIMLLPKLVALLLEYLLPEGAVRTLEGRYTSWRDCSIPEKIQYTVLRPIELANTIWLIYIVCAQTFGAYNTCECQTSSWGNQNYMDFGQYSTTNNAYVRIYWTGGTVISVSTMGVALGYVVLQWCLQSHMSTLDRGQAAKGLTMARRFRVVTMPVLWTYRLLPRGCTFVCRQLARLLEPCGVRVRPPTNTTLRWTRSVSIQCPYVHDPQLGRPLEDLQRAHSATIPQRAMSESLPLIVEPDFVHLSTPSAGNRTPRSSNDRSVSPTGRYTTAHLPGDLSPR